MATARRTTPAKLKAAEKSIVQIRESVEEVNRKLEALHAMQTAFLESSYVSQKVHDKTFGEGVILEQKEDIIKVSFPESNTVKFFVIHRKFRNHPVFENDGEAVAACSDFADRRQNIALLQQERITLEKQLAALELIST